MSIAGWASGLGVRFEDFLDSREMKVDRNGRVVYIAPGYSTGRTDVLCVGIPLSA